MPETYQGTGRYDPPAQTLETPTRREKPLLKQSLADEVFSLRVELGEARKLIEMIQNMKIEIVDGEFSRIKPVSGRFVLELPKRVILAAIKPDMQKLIDGIPFQRIKI